MLKILRKLGRTEGTEIVEAAVVLPLVFMFLLGIVWFGRAFQIYSTITQAAQKGAITAARRTCATCGNNYVADSVVNDSIFAVMDASNLDRNQIIQRPPSIVMTDCPSPAPTHTCSLSTNRITVCRSVVLNAPSTPSQCGVVVSFQYPFQFYLPFTSLNLQQVVLTAEAHSRVEN